MGSNLADIMLEAVSTFKLEKEKEINSKVKSFFEQLKSKGFVLGFKK